MHKDMMEKALPSFLLCSSIGDQGMAGQRASKDALHSLLLSSFAPGLVTMGGPAKGKWGTMALHATPQATRLVVWAIPRWLQDPPPELCLPPTLIAHYGIVLFRSCLL